MTTLQFLLQVLVISLGIIVAAIVIFIFEALWNWARKPDKEKEPKQIIPNRISYKPKSNFHVDYFKTYGDGLKYLKEIRAPHRVDEGLQNLYFKTLKAAYEVLDCMHRLLQDNGYVTVAELFGLIGEPSEYAHKELGWFDLSYAYIAAETPGARSPGHILHLPMAEYIRIGDKSES